MDTRKASDPDRPMPSLPDQDLRVVKAEFLASVSHELRTPLSVIMGYVQILREQTLGPLSTEQIKALDTIFSRADDLLGVVSRLLAARDAQEGKRHLKAEPLELREFIAERLARPSREKERKGTVIETHFPDREVWTAADRQKLGDVLDNLILNAVKFGPRAGRVKIRLDAGALEASLLIEDQGPGFPDGLRQKISEAFSATERGLARDHGGLGLGLYLCAEFLEQQGGRMIIEPSAFGKGCSVRVILPLSSKPAAAVLARNKKRILVVEDDMDFLQLLVIFLSRMGGDAEVVTAETGARAFDDISRRAPDLIILDLMLPGMDGFSILERLKRDPRTASIPVMIVSGYQQVAERAGSSGADEVLIKPFDEALFAAKVSTLLSRASQ
ncbi:MAG: hybrid sensor histidine kinase/response regulator [Elusimicrobiota bacterium]